MKNIKLLLLGLFAITLFSTSCKKEIAGCNDTAATNYDPAATFNDNSCSYEGNVTFWMDGTANPNGVVNVLINGTVKNITASITGVPNCGNQYCANFTLPVGTYSYQAEDQFPVSVQYEGTVTVTKNGCLTMHLK